MTMLEKAIAAAAPVVFPGTGGAEPTPLMKQALERLVRAVLLAIREPDEAMIKASQALWTFEGRYHSDAPAEEQWPAMVDAILKEGPQ